MYSILLALALGGFCTTLAQGGSALSERAAGTCPAEYIMPGFPRSFMCNQRGWVRAPVIESKSTQSDLSACASKCISSSGCKGIRFIEATSTCYVYPATFDDMYTTFDNYKPGILYDRFCFSDDCQVQAACAATKEGDCREFSYETQYGYDAYVFRQFDCSYGYTSLDDEKDVKIFNGTLSNCEAVQTCWDHSRTEFDVYYYKPGQYWICKLFSGKRKNWFSQRNHSIGAAYAIGFFETIY